MAATKESFHNDMLGIYEKVGRGTGYWAKRFLAKVKRSGGVDAAKFWLNKRMIPDGFARLKKEGQLENSMEVLVLKPEYEDLFSANERAVARDRLTAYGYFG
ncbi:hypothetical protein EI77_00397 [Prosthecobacter fusiformis]|uniref:Uncharacterized protein n=1 Tax=Prosthecobacter fusiformis TaxID=48464 RepID=A0A4R7SQY7_9BACT|nr:hypothetical protein [Prosthecobacter fusiformis]TDU81095.1 hypothetical protein EI77_00397 [Prosthecobacter fusiformis]